MRAIKEASHRYVVVEEDAIPTELLKKMIAQKRLVGVVTSKKGVPLGAAGRGQVFRMDKDRSLVENFDIPQLFLDPSANLVEVIGPAKTILSENPSIPAIVVEEDGVIQGILTRNKVTRIHKKAVSLGLEGSSLGGDPTHPARIFMCPLEHMRRVYDSTYQGKAPRCRICGRKMVKGG
jgi:hypothetical protein